VSELNLEEGGAFTVSSAEEILSGKAPSGCDCDRFMNNRLRVRNDDCVITMRYGCTQVSEPRLLQHC
jgi:hypothetical protein